MPLEAKGVMIKKKMLQFKNRKPEREYYRCPHLIHCVSLTTQGHPYIILL